MTTASFLVVGSPVVRQSIFGDWLVDDGSLVPQRAVGRRAAFAEAAARTVVPPAGDSLTQDLSERFATPGGAGSSPTVAAPPAAFGGKAPGSPAVTSPGANDPGATKALFGAEEVEAPIAVGVGASTGTGPAA